MLHTDMAILDSMIAARQEQVATSMVESRRPMRLTVGIGSLLIRIGQRLSHGQVPGDAPAPVLPAKKHPQLA